MHTRKFICDFLTIIVLIYAFFFVPLQRICECKMLCSDLHSALSPILARYESDQIVVVSDDRVGFELPFPSLRLTIDETRKSLQTVQQIWDFLFDHSITRRGLVIAIGGGVLTDMAGFAASTYLRGIDYLNIPTTLLAMIDASTGGKTGCNYRGLKNSIGTFAPPVETLIYPEWLQTLPPQQFLSGFAEMLKTGLLDVNLWEALLQYDLDTMPIAPLVPLIERCILVKERIVASDPHEVGLRKALNLGHTFGHALEELSLTGAAGLTAQRSYSEAVLQRSGLLHGYAVLYGLIAELYLSVTRLGCPKEPLQQLTQIMLHHYGRPNCKCSDLEPLIALMQHDKKNERAAEINCTLIQSVGSPVINQVISVDEAREALDYLFTL